MSCLRPGLLGTLASGDDVDFTGQNGDFLTHGIYWDVKSPWINHHFGIIQTSMDGDLINMKSPFIGNLLKNGCLNNPYLSHHLYFQNWLGFEYERMVGMGWWFI